MYGDSGIRSGAHKIMVCIFLIGAIAAILACVKVVMDHVDGDGNVTSAVDACENEEGMSDLEKAGVFGAAKPRCDK